MSRSKYADISGEEVPTILQQGQNNFTGVNMEGTTPNLINGYMLGDVTGLTPAPDSLKRIKYYERYGKDTPYYMLDSYTKANEPIDLKEILPYLSNSYDQTTIKNNIKNKVPMEFHPLNESYSPVHPSFNLAGHGVLID